VPALLPKAALQSPDRINSDRSYNDHDSDDFNFDDDIDEEDIGLQVVSNLKREGTDLLAQSRELFSS
jgi:hypothetical protein